MRDEELYLENENLSEDELYHYGTPRHSGRYPWGSGENPYQHCSYFMSEVNRMRKEGMTDKEIWTAMDMSSGEFRSKITIANERITKENRQRARELKEKGYSNTAIAEMMGVSEGTIRNYLKEETNNKGKPSTAATALYLKDQVDGKGLIDVGTGVERELGISDVALDAAIKQLEEDGYISKTIRVEQMTNPGKYTEVRVLAPAGTETKYIYEHIGDIQSVTDYDQFAKMAEEKHPGFERTKYGMYYPQSIDRSRILVKYDSDITDENGSLKDGVIEIRRGVEDLSLGKSNYAQVRIAVDDKYYLKGVAMYSDDMPDGVDVIFNSHKKPGTPDEDVFKKLKDDRNNPFGAAIKPEEKGGQRFYLDEDGNEHLAAVNIVNSQGDWGDWSKTLSSQFLSKQNEPLVKSQLDLTYSNKLDEYGDILAITNPVIRQKELLSFADDCDASAVHLKATALPGQTSNVILPIVDMKPNEIYAPNYKTGDKVVLIRYPHAATFEIPELTVNNEQKTAKRLLGNVTDAVGIPKAAAEQLSGADFDGDTVMVIPVSKGKLGTKIRTDSYPEKLKNFSTDDYAVEDKNSPLYLCDEEHGFYKQREMGKVSNLITDMTLLGADQEEIIRAVKHSMVVIDAPKHHLDWRKSELDNGIAELKTKYQGGPNRGAATLISRASSETQIPKRKTLYSDPNDPNIKNGINIVTGEKAYKDTGETYHKPIYAEQYKRDPETGDILTNPITGKKLKEPVLVLDEKTGKYKKQIIGYKEEETTRTTTTTKMAAAKDANELLSESRNVKEVLYANYANQMKALANAARKEAVSTEIPKQNPSAREVYKEEVQSLNAKLDIALRNAPRERQAQVAANAIFKIQAADNPTMSNDDKKKVKSQILAEQRVRYGAKKERIEITDKEWEAIQANAISASKLRDILNNTDADALKKRAMPKDYYVTLTPAKENRIKQMLARGFTQKEIADAVGVSTSTVNSYILGKG